MVQINGRRVLVTGGQRGLGAAFTKALLEHGAERVYVTARNPKPSNDPRIVPLALDVTQQESVDALVAQASDVSVVINNAGILTTNGVLDTPLADIQGVFDTNVYGPLRIAKAFAATLTSHDTSALVNISSVLSWLAGTGAYGASKAALSSFTNSLRMELAPKGTLVSGVHLATAETDMSAEFGGPKATPEFVAAAVVAGIEADDSEILVDDFSRDTKALLTGPVEELVIEMPAK